MNVFYSPDFERSFDIKSIKGLKALHDPSFDVGYLNGVHNWWVVTDRFKQVVEKYNFENIQFTPLLGGTYS